MHFYSHRKYASTNLLVFKIMQHSRIFVDSQALSQWSPQAGPGGSYIEPILDQVTFSAGTSFCGILGLTMMSVWLIVSIAGVKNNFRGNIIPFLVGFAVLAFMATLFASVALPGLGQTHLVSIRNAGASSGTYLGFGGLTAFGNNVVTSMIPWVGSVGFILYLLPFYFQAKRITNANSSNGNMPWWFGSLLTNNNEPLRLQELNPSNLPPAEQVFPARDETAPDDEQLRLKIRINRTEKYGWTTEQPESSWEEVKPEGARTFQERKFPINYSQRGSDSRPYHQESLPSSPDKSSLPAGVTTAWPKDLLDELQAAMDSPPKESLGKRALKSFKGLFTSCKPKHPTVDADEPSLLTGSPLLSPQQESAKPRPRPQVKEEPLCDEKASTVDAIDRTPLKTTYIRKDGTVGNIRNLERRLASQPDESPSTIPDHLTFLILLPLAIILLLAIGRRVQPLMIKYRRRRSQRRLTTLRQIPVKKRQPVVKRGSIRV